MMSKPNGWMPIVRNALCWLGIHGYSPWRRMSHDNPAVCHRTCWHCGYTDKRRFRVREEK